MAARENFIPEKRRGASCSDTYVFPGNKFLVFLVSRSACLQPFQGRCGPVHSLRGSRAGAEASQGQLRQVSDSKTNFYFAKVIKLSFIDHSHKPFVPIVDKCNFPQKPLRSNLFTHRTLTYRAGTM